jgi:hypothetical protein
MSRVVRRSNRSVLLEIRNPSPACRIWREKRVYPYMRSKFRLFIGER